MSFEHPWNSLQFDPMNTLQYEIFDIARESNSSALWTKNWVIVGLINFFITPIIAALTTIYNAVILAVKFTCAIIIFPIVICNKSTLPSDLNLFALLVHCYKVVAFTIGVVVLPIFGSICPERTFFLLVRIKLIKKPFHPTLALNSWTPHDPSSSQIIVPTTPNDPSPEGKPPAAHFHPFFSQHSFSDLSPFTSGKNSVNNSFFSPTNSFFSPTSPHVSLKTMKTPPKPFGPKAATPPPQVDN